MKKTFLARRNALLTPSGLTPGVIALLVVLLCVGLRFIAPNLFLQIFTPFFHFGDQVSARVHGFTSGFRDAQSLAASSARLETENAALSLQNRMLSERINDFSSLALQQSSPLTGILAGVLARPPQSPYDTLIVGAGTNAGVTLYMEAYGAGGVPLGTVTAVSDSFSRITLFSSSGQQILGWVGKSRVPLTLFGAGGGAFRANVSKSAGIAVGDGVYVPGPGALFIGTVGHIETDPSSPSASLLITPALNLFSVTWVTLADAGASFRSAAVATSTKP